MTITELLITIICLSIFLVVSSLCIGFYFKHLAEEKEEEDFYNEYYSQEELDVRNAKAREIQETRKEKKY